MQFNTARIVRDFTANLTRALPGKDNAGARAKLRRSVRAWAADNDDPREFAAVVRSSARTLALTHTGRAALERAIAAVDLDGSSLGDPE